jgi:hypothetical protein
MDVSNENHRQLAEEAWPVGDRRQQQAVSLAALIAVKAGHRPRLIYRTRRPGDQHKCFAETDYARLLDVAHQQLGGPPVVVWDRTWAHLKRSLADLAKHTIGQLTALAGPCSDGCSTRPGSAAASSPAPGSTSHPSVTPRH